MPQSLSKVIIHIIFSTKNRVPCISEPNRKELQAMIVSKIAKVGSYTYELYVNPDHVHILCTLPRIITIAQLISKIKTPTSAWLKTKGIPNFHWQDGYATFSVSPFKIDVVSNYIRTQPEHHEKSSIKNELRTFFVEYGIDYDERYVWD